VPDPIGPVSSPPSFGDVGYEVPLVGMPSTPSVPTVPTSPGGVPTVPGSPFGMPLDLSSIGGVQAMSMPVLPEPVTGEAPYWIPTEPVRDEVRIESHERRDDKIARDLGGTAFDPYTVRKDFPILEERVHGGKRLVWLDNAATTQKPRYV